MKNSTETQKDHAEVVSEIKKKKGNKTLRSFAKEIGVNHGYLSAIIGGTRPASNTVRIALGLHPLHVTVTPCARCGNVHVTKRCTAIKSTRKPDPVVRVARVDAARIAALSALYAQRGIGEARYRVELQHESDAMAG